MEPRDQQNIYEKWQAVPEETIQEWLKLENLNKRETRKFNGFEIVNSIDGRVDPSVEISFVRIKEGGLYPRHVHDNSDAYFVIIAGQAILLGAEEQRKIEAGERIEIPRGTPHGFELGDGESLEFVSFQSPPIKDDHTGEEDFRLIDHI